MSLESLAGWRFQVENKTGVTIDESESSDIIVRQRRVDLSTGGAFSDEGSGVTTLIQLSTDGNQTDLADNSYYNTAAQDHSGAGNRWIGGVVEFEVTIGSGASQSSPDGNVNLYMQPVGDPGSPNWPSDGEGWLKVSFSFTSTGTTQKRNVRI